MWDGCGGVEGEVEGPGAGMIGNNKKVHVLNDIELESNGLPSRRRESRRGWFIQVGTA